MAQTYVILSFGPVIVWPPPVPQYINVTWTTRDQYVTWKTRDEQVVEVTRDEQATWKTRS